MTQWSGLTPQQVTDFALAYDERMMREGKLILAGLQPGTLASLAAEVATAIGVSIIALGCPEAEVRDWIHAIENRVFELRSPGKNWRDD